MNKLDEVDFSSRTDWRRWLMDNHAHSSGIWLVYDKTGSSRSDGSPRENSGTSVGSEPPRSLKPGGGGPVKPCGCC